MSYVLFLPCHAWEVSRRLLTSDEKNIVAGIQQARRLSDTRGQYLKQRLTRDSPSVVAVGVTGLIFPRFHPCMSSSGSESLETPATRKTPALRNDLVPVVWKFSKLQSVSASRTAGDANKMAGENNFRELMKVKRRGTRPYAGHCVHPLPLLLYAAAIPLMSLTARLDLPSG